MNIRKGIQYKKVKSVEEKHIKVKILSIVEVGHGRNTEFNKR